MTTVVPAPDGVRTYRARSGVVVLILSALFALFILGDAVIRAGWDRMLLLAPWVLLGLWLVHVVSFASSVRLDDHGGSIQNFLRRTSFGWRRVVDIDLRWQIEFSLDDGSRVTAYGGPARARPTRARTPDGEAVKAPAGIRELTAIRDRWETAPTTADDPIRRSWDVPALIALSLLVLSATASVLIA